MLNVYDTVSSYRSIIDDIYQCDEISEDHISILGNIEEDLNKKVLSIGSIIKNMEGECHVISSTVIDLQKKQMRLLKKIEYLKQYVQSTLEICGIKSVTSPLLNINIRYNPASVVVEDEALIPEEYFNTKTERSIDKQKIRDILMQNEGYNIPGVCLHKKTRIEIK